MIIKPTNVATPDEPQQDQDITIIEQIDRIVQLIDNPDSPKQAFRTSQPDNLTAQLPPNQGLNIVTVRVHAKVHRINKSDEILDNIDNLNYRFTTKAHRGFHVDDNFYGKVMDKIRRHMDEQEPLRTFRTNNMDYAYESIKIQYLFQNLAQEDDKFEMDLPLTFSHKHNQPEPTTKIRNGEQTMDIQIAMQCTVLKPRPMETITRVPFFTNKQACENAISRLKMIAHYSSTMMPHITMCKLNELLHHFRMESNGIFMKTTPTVYPLPPTTDAEDKFHHIFTNQPPPMVNLDSTAQGESTIKKTFQATPKSANVNMSDRPKPDTHHNTKKRAHERHTHRQHTRPGPPKRAKSPISEYLDLRERQFREDRDLRDAIKDPRLLPTRIRRSLTPIGVKWGNRPSRFHPY